LEKEGVVAIYLKASIETLSTRLILDKEARPLISNLSTIEIKEFIAKHLFERSFYYHQAPKVIVVDSKSISQIVEEISSILA
jgi:shikimate kinase